MNRAELRGWIEDALSRHERDSRERDETPSQHTVPEIVDAVWGRLPLEVRRATSRSAVQASLTLLTVRRGLGYGGAAGTGHDRGRHALPSADDEHANKEGTGMADEQVRQEISELDARIAELKKSATDLRASIGDGGVDSEEVAMVLTSAEEEEAQAGTLEERRRTLAEQLGEQSG